jgi:hypothetical protein
MTKLSDQDVIFVAKNIAAANGVSVVDVTPSVTDIRRVLTPIHFPGI